jgi:hypothetical protein
VRLLVDVDYFGYFYYDVAENAFARTTNPFQEIRIIDEIIRDIMMIAV